MIKSVDYIIERITEDGIHSIKIYEGHVKHGLDNAPMYRRMSGDDVAEKVKKFKEADFGNFTFLLRETDNTSLANAQRVFVQNAEVINGVQQQAQPMYDLEQIKEDIRNEYRREEELKRLREERDIAQEELERSRQPAEKLSFLLENVLNSFQAKKQPAALQGTDPQTTTQQMSQPTVSTDQVENACATLINLFGHDDFVYLADKLASDQVAFGFVQNYIKQNKV